MMSEKGLTPAEAVACLERECTCQNLIFDLDDTLYRRYEPYALACERAFAGRGLPDGLTIYRAGRRISDEEYYRETSGEISYEEMLISRTTRSFALFGLTLSPEEALRFERLYREAQDEIRMVPDFAAFFMNMQREPGGRRLGIMTNGGRERQRNKLARLGLIGMIPEELIYISGDTGVSKPATEAFRLFERQAGLLPEETILIGDSQENDILGARRAGWKSLYVAPW